MKNALPPGLGRLPQARLHLGESHQGRPAAGNAVRPDRADEDGTRHPLRNPLLAGTALICLFGGGPALAQGAAAVGQGPGAPGQAGTVEPASAEGTEQAPNSATSTLARIGAAPAVAEDEVVVTGSSIRGVAPVGSPLIGVTRETINAVAPTNVKEVLATVPALGNFNTNAEQSTPNRFRTAGYIPNIHNLGVYATLTLINGHRVTGVGTEATFADPSTIPPIAIQRTEIVADGASAIYGSDAVAGVVNFIFRRPFDGVEAQSTYSFDAETRYRRREASVIAGKRWNGGGLMAAYAYSDNRSPLATEIPTLALGGDQRSRGGRDLRGNNCQTPVIRGVNERGVPVGTSYGSSERNFSTNAVDLRCGRISAPMIIPDGDRHAFLATAEHQLTDTVRLRGELNLGYYDTEFTEQRGGISVLLNRGSPFFTQQNIPPALFNNPAVTRVSVTRSAIGLLSPTTTTLAQSKVITGVIGLDIDLSSTWKGSLTFVNSQSRDFHQFFQLDQNNLLVAVTTNDLTRALNLFTQASGNSPAVLATIDNGTSQRNYGRNRLTDFGFKADGVLFSIPGGEVRAAIGTSFRNEEMKQRQLSGSEAPNSGFFSVTRNDNVNRTIIAAFGEVNIPLVSEENAFALARALTFSISGRFDHYDKYGLKFNPKFGAVWSPLEGVNVRGSYGTNFAAPSIGILGGSFGQIGYNANPALVIGYGPFQGTLLSNINQYSISGGNPNLQPEKATTRSAGIDVAPVGGFLRGFRASASYYHVRYSNLISQPLTADLITNPAFAAFTEFFPTAERIAELIRQVPPTAPITVPLGNFQYIQTTGAINIGTRIFEGIDYDISYRVPTQSIGAFNLGVSANQQLKFDQEVLSGSGFQSRLNTLDAVKWKARFALGWQLEPVTVNLFVNYTHSYKNVSVTPAQKVDPFTTTDLTVAYEIKQLLNGVTIQGRVANLFDKDPPFYDSAAGYNGGLASPFPRSFDIVLRAKF